MLPSTFPSLLLLLLQIPIAVLSSFDQHGHSLQLYHVDIITSSSKIPATIVAYNVIPSTKPHSHSHSFSQKISPITAVPTHLSLECSISSNDNNVQTPSRQFHNILLDSRNSSEILPFPVIIATHLSAQRTGEMTRGLYVLEGYAAADSIDWSTCWLVCAEINPTQQMFVAVNKAAKRQTLRVLWTDHHHSIEADDVVNPLNDDELESAEDIDNLLMRYAASQMSVAPHEATQDDQHQDLLSFAELEVEVEEGLLNSNNGCDGEEPCKNSEIASVLWHRVRGLFSSNVSVGASAPIESQRPCVCIDPALSDCLSFPNHVKGDPKLLEAEDASGSHSAILSSDHNMFATPNEPGERIIVYGALHQNTKLRTSIWVGNTLFYGRSMFKKGERIDLRGFKKKGNHGIFQIVRTEENQKDDKGISGVVCELEAISPSSAEPGRVKQLQYEANRDGGMVTGCFGKRAGPATKETPIIVYGSSSSGSNEKGLVLKINEQRTYWIRFAPSFLVSAYDIGELIRLQHFRLSGNTGVFRVRSKPMHDVLEISEIQSCAATNLLCTSSLDSLLRDTRRARDRDMLVRRVNRCPRDCYNHGRIEGKACSCDAGFNPTTCCETRLKRNTLSQIEELHCPSALATVSCSGHGICDESNGVCACDNSWKASDCSEPILPCPNKCSSHGVCQTASGRCHCDSSWSGFDCSISNVFCPNDCCTLTHGKCNHDTGRCTCRPGYSGLDCCSVSLPCCQTCSEHGTCDGMTGQCTCNPGYGAECCGKKLCPMDCHSDERHGVCQDGICKCEPSFTGTACETPVLPCPDSCSGHGACNTVTGECACEVTWSGIDCGIPYVPCNCSVPESRGICDTTIGKMHCSNSSFVGPCCERIPCFRNCSGSSHGQCNALTSLCVCSRAWMGADCSISKCGSHGTMLTDGSCRADEHYFSPIQGGVCDRVGPLCRPDNRCLADSSDGDTCSQNAVGCSHVGACMCRMGWTGATCETRLEPTGEQNRKNFLKAKVRRQADTKMSLHKSAYLVYAGARFPIETTSPAKEDFQVVFDLFGYSSNTPLETLSDAKAILDRGDANGDKRIQFNEFLTLGSLTEKPFVNLIPRAISFVFRMLDYDADAVASFQDIAMSMSRSFAVAHWNSLLLSEIQDKKNNRETPSEVLSLGAGTILQGSRRCKMQSNPCDRVSPGDWLNIDEHAYDVYQV